MAAPGDRGQGGLAALAPQRFSRPTPMPGPGAKTPTKCLLIKAPAYAPCQSLDMARGHLWKRGARWPVSEMITNTQQWRDGGSTGPQSSNLTAMRRPGWAELPMAIAMHMSPATRVELPGVVRDGMVRE